VVWQIYRRKIYREHKTLAGIMRDIALVIIAIVEINDLGERHGWW